MEDAHVADVGLPGGEEVALFAVFDGHGGQVRADALSPPNRLDPSARPSVIPRGGLGVGGTFSPFAALILTPPSFSSHSCTSALTGSSAASPPSPSPPAPALPAPETSWAGLLARRPEPD